MVVRERKNVLIVQCSPSAEKSVRRRSAAAVDAADADQPAKRVCSRSIAQFPEREHKC